MGLELSKCFGKSVSTVLGQEKWAFMSEKWKQSLLGSFKSFLFFSLYQGQFFSVLLFFNLLIHCSIFGAGIRTMDYMRKK